MRSGEGLNRSRSDSGAKIIRRQDRRARSRQAWKQGERVITARATGRHRYRCEGLAGLRDRSSRPHRLRRPTPQTVAEEIERLRRQRWTGKQIAAATGESPATVSRVLRRLGLNELTALEPAEPVRRYERIRARSSGHPSRHQKARADRLCGPPHHWAISRRSQPSPRHRLGVRSCLHR